MRRLAAGFLTTSGLLCAPSYFAWFKRPFDIGAVEFDTWLGLLPVQLPGQIVHTVLFATLGVLYVMICRRSEAIPRWLVPASWTIFFGAVPWVSPDVMFYLAKGWMETRYGLDPYVVAIGSVPSYASDPMLAGVAPSLIFLLGNYGPAFQKLSSLVAFVSIGSPVAGLLLFKGIFAAGLIGCFVLIRRLATAVGQHDPNLDRWFLLNPLLLFNFLTAAHNDVLLMLLLLGAVLALFRGHSFWAGVCVGVSISFKLAGIFLLPVLAGYVFLVEGWSRRLKGLALALTGMTLGTAGGLLINPESIRFFRTVVGNRSAFRSSVHLVLSPVARRTRQSAWPRLHGRGKGGLSGYWRLWCSGSISVSIGTNRSYSLSWVALRSCCWRSTLLCQA